MSSHERWTKDAILARIQIWCKRYEQPPRLTDWRHSGADEDGAYPSEATVKAKCGSWNTAIGLAGFTARSIGRPGNYIARGGPYLTDTKTTGLVDQYAVFNQPACYCPGAQKKLDAIKALIESDGSTSHDTIMTIINA